MLLASKTRQTTFSLIVPCVWALAAGCNVDGVWERSQPPKGAPLAGGAAEPERNPAPPASELSQQEVDLVEAVISHRDEYHRALGELRDYYRERGYAAKQSWADFELDGISKVKTFRYVLDSEVASEKLRPTDQISEADALYQSGLDLMKKGGDGIPVFYRQKTMIQAADAFRELIEKYPTSDRIDDAAFFLGEIHKEYLPNQEQIAVQWYERAWTWDPTTPHPARFQAAVVYDFRLHDRDRALELYRAVVSDETAEGSDARFAARRIRQLDQDQGEVTAKIVEKDADEP